MGLTRLEPPCGRPLVAAVPARVRWALDVLDPAPADEILEVGGGPGISAGLVCDQLTTGRLLAVDRSAVAIARTEERNAAHLTSGRLAVEQCSLDALAVPDGSIDKAFCVDVNLFWVRDATPELAVLHRLLRPGGLLLVLYGAGSPAGAERVLGRVGAAVREAGFADVGTLTAEAGFGISARRPR